MLHFWLSDVYIYELLNCNLSIAKVPHVISAVLKMAGKIANKLTSKLTIIDINLQRLVISQTQVGDVFSQKEATTDEQMKPSWCSIYGV